MTAHRATAYLIVKAERSRYVSADRETGLRPVGAVKIIGSRQGRPAKLERDEVAIKVTVEIPDAAFQPFSPSALVVVPTDLALPGPIGVEAVDANPSTEG
jgi:hypothetical protein